MYKYNLGLKKKAAAVVAVKEVTASVKEAAAAVAVAMAEAAVAGGCDCYLL